MKKLFVATDNTIKSGREAEALLKRVNDKQHLSDSQGILHVPIERWQTAQSAERNFWMLKNATASEDRNDYHRQRFQDYAVLRGERFADALEIGCGPFTNLRIVAEHAKIRRCTLLDPLIFEYMRHRNCYYDRHFLYSGPRPRTIVRRLTSKRTRVAELVASPAEDYSPSRRFDLVAIINVIEHCYSVSRVFETVLRAVKPNAILLFADKLYQHAAVANTVHDIYDAAHPLKVDQTFIRDFLSAHFNSLYEDVYRNSMEIEGETIEWYELYYAGSAKDTV